MTATTKAHETNGTPQEAATFSDLFSEVDRLGKAAIRERERSIEEMKRVQRETLEKLDELDEEAAKLMRDFHAELTKRNARLVQTAKAETLALSVEIDAALHARQKPQPLTEEVKQARLQGYDGKPCPTCRSLRTLSSLDGRFACEDCRIATEVCESIKRSSLAPEPGSVRPTRIESHPSTNGSNGAVKAAVEVAEQVEKDGEVLLGVPAANGMMPVISREGEQSQHPTVAVTPAAETRGDTTSAPTGAPATSTATEKPKPTRRRR